MSPIWILCRNAKQSQRDLVEPIELIKPIKPEEYVDPFKPVELEKPVEPKKRIELENRREPLELAEPVIDVITWQFGYDSDSGLISCRKMITNTEFC